MPNKRTRKGKRQSGRKQVQNRNGSGPANTALIYRGPVRLPGAGAVVQTIIANLVLATNVNSDNTGKLIGVIKNDPSVLNDWVSYSRLYQEFRVLAFSVKFVPGAVVNTISGTNQVTTAPLVHYAVRDGNYANLTSYTLAYDQEGSIVSHTSKKWTHVVRMNGSVEASWQNTISTPVAYAGIGYYAEGLLGNAYIGSFFQEALIQFRARQ